MAAENRVTKTHVGERTTVHADDEVGQVRASGRRERQPGPSLERRQEGRGDAVQGDVGVAAVQAERARVLVVHRAQDDRVVGRAADAEARRA